MTRLHAMPVAPAVAVLALVVVPLTAGCVSNAPASGGAGTIGVESSATECRLSATHGARRDAHVPGQEHGRRGHRVLPARRGRRADRRRGRERRARGSPATSWCRPRPGAYFAACKPGMVGDGIRSAVHRDRRRRLRVARRAPRRSSWPTPRRPTSPTCASTPPTSSPAPARSPMPTRPATTTRPATSTPPTRVHWESIEPVAESFGDLDPLLDAREADLAEGDAWSGWHLIEKDLWPPAPEANGGDGVRAADADAERAAAAKDLVDVHAAARRQGQRRRTSRSPAFQIANGAKELLDEVATGKVTGEEEIWSHTDLWDFQANVDGAKQAFEVLRGRRLGARPRARRRRSRRGSTR